jgi:hypothetical protein
MVTVTRKLSVSLFIRFRALPELFLKFICFSVVYNQALKILGGLVHHRAKRLQRWKHGRIILPNPLVGQIRFSQYKHVIYIGSQRGRDSQRMHRDYQENFPVTTVHEQPHKFIASPRLVV